MATEHSNSFSNGFGRKRSAAWDQTVMKFVRNKSKVGIGTWDIDALGSAIDDVDRLNFNWYYTWSTTPLYDATPGSTPRAEFVPMIWDETHVAESPGSSTYLLGFNEPDNVEQANMTVEDALLHWPTLVSHGKILGSPAPTTDQTFGVGSWLGLFMYYVDTSTVDFVAVHYYTTDKSINTFKQWLDYVYAAYGKPIWITEWGLVDWLNLDRFSVDEVAKFARDATLMLDTIPYVHRHAWFAAYPYMYGGEFANTELLDSGGGTLTKTGRAFDKLL